MEISIIFFLTLYGSLNYNFQIRKTRRVSFFPVGLVSRLGVSTPIVRAGRIVGFYDGWIGNRLFPVDMAGFAVNIRTLKEVTLTRSD